MLLVTKAETTVDTFSPSDVGAYLTWFDGSRYVNSKILVYSNPRLVFIELYGSVGAHSVGTNWSLSPTDKRFIERMESRISSRFFVDSGLTFDGTNMGVTAITLSGGTLWDETETLTATASTAIFTGAADVGDQLVFMLNDVAIRLTVAAYTNGTTVSVTPNKIVPTTHRDTPRTDWAWARDTMAGLDHLEGLEVAILADGSVQPHQQVVGGKVTLSPPGVKADAGLPIQADLETLDLSVPGIETLLPKTKAIPSATVLVQDSSALKIGRSFDTLQEEPLRSIENYDSPVAITTRKVQVRFHSTWDKTGCLAIRQDNPLPLTVLGIIPDVTQGGV